MSYTQDQIRNIVLAGHSGTGKTTLAEALLYSTGGSDRLGRVEDGNTVSDYDPEEKKRGASMFAASIPVDYTGVRLNFIDVPGLFDFELGLHEAMPAAEAALICVSARDGLQVGAGKAYRLAEKYGKSKMFYISKVDVEHADFYKVFEELKAEYGPSVCPVVVPVDQAGGRIYVDLIDNKAYSYAADGAAREVPVPSIGHRLEGLVAAMSEAVAETDEELMEKYFSGEPFTRDELIRGVRLGVKEGTITPVICGNATKMAAMDLVLEMCCRLLPSADRAAGVTALNANEEPVEVPCDPNGPIFGYVFKTVADPFVGKLSYIKMVSGVLKSDSSVINSRTGEAERLGKLVTMKGKTQIDTPAIIAGDIGAITKLAATRTGDCLCAAGSVLHIELPIFPIPTMSMALRVKQKGDEGKISGALQRLIEEDCTLNYTLNTETTQQIISGLGEQHLESIVSKLKTKFGVEVDLDKPRVAYRESIRKKVKTQGRHKKQTGGHGQFGDVWIEFEPTDSEGLVFETNVFGGSVPKNFFPAVEKGLQNAVEHGVLAGYPVVGLKATLVDGSYHPVDSSEMAFKMAARIAYKAGLAQAGPMLLEPIGTLHAYVPDTNTGDVMGEVTKRRGRVLGMSAAEDGLQLVEAEVPQSEMFDFTTFMRQLTQGRGWYTFEFTRYEALPSNLEAKVAEEGKKVFGTISDEE